MEQDHHTAERGRVRDPAYQVGVPAVRAHSDVDELVEQDGVHSTHNSNLVEHSLPLPSCGLSRRGQLGGSRGPDLLTQPAHRGPATASCVPDEDLLVAGTRQ